MSGFIVLEGIDGCGKSTVAKLVAARIGDRAVLTREPTDSWIGRAVKQGGRDPVSPYRDALLFMVDRAQHTLEISELLRQGQIVVCDRYYHSTVAYQAAAIRRHTGEDAFDWLIEANMRISIRPDATFLIDVPPEVGLSRIKGRPESSRFERLDFLREVRKNYAKLAKVDGSIIVVDGTRNIESVVVEVLGQLRKRNI